MPDDTPLSYADAGVDLDAADASVELLKQHVRSTTRPEVLGGIGGFGGLFQLDLDRYRQPVLVSGTDGVGTKVDLARRLGVLDTVGIDLVAMVVDDLVVTGAEPLFFNDYISVGQLVPERVEAAGQGRRRRAAARPARRWSAGRSPNTPACWARTSSTWPASASAWSSATPCSGRSGSRRATCCWPCPAPGCTATATRWCAGSWPTSTSTGRTAWTPRWARCC